MEDSSIELIELGPERRLEVSRLLADAFLNDPAWVAIGPARESRRLRLLRAYYRIVLKEALRHGGPSWCATRDGSALGAAVTFGDGLAYPPRLATLAEGPPFLLAGPGPAVRGARVNTIMNGRHPPEPHLFVWQLAAHPTAQRQGVGRALLSRVLEEGERRGTPVYLDTTNPDNVPYYASHGFRVVEEAALVRGARVWCMLRDAP
jgi:ribosomal protein S18 acetylase RimI-like enzyme